MLNILHLQIQNQCLSHSRIKIQKRLLKSGISFINGNKYKLHFFKCCNFILILAFFCQKQRQKSLVTLSTVTQNFSKCVC